jgi:hypothetical protein
MEFTSKDVDGIRAEANAKGMFVVDPNSSDALLDEYDETLIEADILMSQADPDTTPYASKYKARELLDTLINKLEATKTVSMMEGKKQQTNDLAWRIAAIQVKLGVLSWEVEEPHNCQSELERAVSVQ